MSLIEHTAIIGSQTLVELKPSVHRIEGAVYAPLGLHDMPWEIYDHGRKFFLPAGTLRGHDVKTKVTKGRLPNKIDLVEILARESIDITCPEQSSLAEQIAAFHDRTVEVVANLRLGVAAISHSIRRHSRARLDHLGGQQRQPAASLQPRIASIASMIRCGFARVSLIIRACSVRNSLSWHATFARDE